MRLIDADELFKALDDICIDFNKPREAVVYVDCIADIISDAPTVDAVEVVRCKECKWYDPPHIKHNDGRRTDVDEDAPFVTISVGINVAGQCIHHSGLKIYCLNHDREDMDDNEDIVIFRKPNDFCSYGEKKQ